MRYLTSLVFSTALCLAGSASAADPAFVGKYVSTPQDTAAINKVITDFQTALKTKNVHLLSSLMVSNSIMFSSPPAPEFIKKMQETTDVSFNGLATGGYVPFAMMIKREKGMIEERFYNVRITQDGDMAVVMFDFDFRLDGKIENHGLETWQMMKNKDSQWKIASVFWSTKGEPK